MQYVKLVVPKHLYDKLGLQLNQTIELRNSRSISELDTHENSVSTSNNSSELASPNAESNDRTIENVVTASPLEINSTAFQAVLVNADAAGNEELKGLFPGHNVKTVEEATPHTLKPTVMLSSQSFSELEASESESDDISENKSIFESESSSDDENISPLQDIAKPGMSDDNTMPIDACDAEGSESMSHPMQCDNEVIQRNTNKLSSSKRPVYLGCASESMCRPPKQRIIYSRLCTTCGRTFSSLSSFAYHKSKCGLESESESSSRLCTTCGRTFSSLSSFAYHKSKCGLKSESESSSRLCTTCGQTFTSLSSYAYHKSKCVLESESESSSDGEYTSPAQTIENPGMSDYNAIEFDACDAERNESISHNRVVQKNINNLTPVKPPVYQGCANAFIYESHRQKIVYPRLCTACGRTYSSDSSFSFHKKKCGLERVKKPPRIVYPRMCRICNRYYSNSSSFNKHKRICDKYKRKLLGQVNLRSIARPLNSGTVPEFYTHINDNSTSDSPVKLNVSKELCASTAEDNPEKWVPVTNCIRKQKYFVVKKPLS